MSVVNGVRVAIAPPPGYEVDFEHPARRSVTETYIISSLGMALAAFFVYQRLFVKHYLRHNLGYDDLLLVIAWLGSIAIQALIIYSLHHVIMGVHAWEIPYEKFRQFAVIGGYTTSIIYVVPTALSKIVILLFFRELESKHKWYRRCIHGAMFIVAASSIAVLLVSIFPCQPLAMSWDLDLADGPGHCVNRKGLYEATAAFGVAVDLTIIALPIPLVIALRVSTLQRMGILLLFTLGSATIITSIVRLALLISNLDVIDQTWGGGPVCMWVCVEANMLIMAASQFTLPHFIKSVAAQFIAHKPKPKPKKQVTSSNHEMRTFGATSSKHYYSRFDETDIGTDTIVNVQGLPPVDYDQDGDCESQHSQRPIRGIMQTKETVIRYEMMSHS